MLYILLGGEKNLRNWLEIMKNDLKAFKLVNKIALNWNENIKFIILALVNWS